MPEVVIVAEDPGVCVHRRQISGPEVCQRSVHHGVVHHFGQEAPTLLSNHFFRFYQALLAVLFLHLCWLVHVGGLKGDVGRGAEGPSIDGLFQRLGVEQPQGKARGPNNACTDNSAK